MPKVNTRNEERDDKGNQVPDGLKAYRFHGMHFDYGSRDKEALTECPFCSKEGKFSVNLKTGQWRCWSCGGGLEKGGGGVLTFLKLFWELCDKSTTSYRDLQEHRGLEQAETVMQWGAVKSVLNGDWLLPAYLPDPKRKGQVYFCQLYRYTSIYSQSKGGKRQVLLPTPSEPKLSHGVFGLHLWDHNKEEVHICEGPWDGARLWETLKTIRRQDQKEDSYLETGSKEYCLLSDANVIAVAGTNAFPPVLASYIKDKVVFLYYDNDYPRENPKTGILTIPAGQSGAKRATAHLCKHTDEIYYVAWGNGAGFDQNHPDGFDVRDALADSKTEGFKMLMEQLQPVPDEWTDTISISEDEAIPCLPCSDYKTLVRSWRKALRWNKGLDSALGVMLASVASTNSIGDQLWMKILGPPSCGKSTLCEALTVNKKYVIAKSKITGFHSGYRDSNDPKQDNGLIPQLMGRTFVLKDGDTLLQSPALGEILADARDLYDSVSRSHYKNRMGKDYEGIRMTWLLCGTSSLRSIDSSELGQRFLDCVIMERIDDEEEDKILWRQANKAANHVSIEVSPEDKTSHYSPDLLEAMQLTGGYVQWLRENAYKHLKDIHIADNQLRQLVKLGKFVAYMRSRPSKLQNEEPTREMAARLVSQHTRLAKCLALVLNKEEADEEVMQRVRKVAFDTGRGIVLNIAKHLWKAGKDGMQIKTLNLYLNCTEPELRALLRFLRGIQMVEFVRIKNKNVWRLTQYIYDLCTELEIDNV